MSISITEKASKKVTELLKTQGKESYGLKVSVVPGGCAGFSYNLEFAEKAIEGEKTIESNNVKLFVPEQAEQFIQGLVIDYTDGLHGAGFTFNNPSAKSGCGCGSSFGV